MYIEIIPERVRRIELPSSAWKADIIATIRHPQDAQTLACRHTRARRVSPALMRPWKDSNPRPSAPQADALSTELQGLMGVGRAFAVQPLAS